MPENTGTFAIYKHALEEASKRGRIIPYDASESVLLVAERKRKLMRLPCQCFSVAYPRESTFAFPPISFNQSLTDEQNCFNLLMDSGCKVVVRESERDLFCSTLTFAPDVTISEWCYDVARCARCEGGEFKRIRNYVVRAQKESIIQTQRGRVLTESEMDAVSVMAETWRKSKAERGVEIRKSVSSDIYGLLKSLSGRGMDYCITTMHVGKRMAAFAFSERVTFNTIIGVYAIHDYGSDNPKSTNLVMTMSEMREWHRSQKENSTFNLGSATRASLAAFKNSMRGTLMNAAFVSKA